MIKSYDVGSLPPKNDSQKYLINAHAVETSNIYDNHIKKFEEIIVETFIDKIRMGIDIPNYPQFRDMTQMFLDMIEGIEKTKDGYLEVGDLKLKKQRGAIAEIMILRRHLHEISLEIQRHVNIKLCITGPYTLSTLFPYRRAETIQKLGNILTQVLEKNIFNEKEGKVSIVSLDEPTFGLINDPLIDKGSIGREILLKTWEKIFYKIKTQNVDPCLHLHTTANDLFWEAESLKIVESHVEDAIYKMKQTKKRLEETDKLLKASICKTDFDQLIKNHIVTASREKQTENKLNEIIAETWKNIKLGKLNPTIYLENIQLMKKRLTIIIENYGKERVPYAGPECGLRGFPSYTCALECLKRVADTCKEF